MRKSPTQSAAASKLGLRKKGNDGFMWVVVKARNGVQRWAREGREPRRADRAPERERPTSKADRIAWIRRHPRALRALVSHDESEVHALQRPELIRRLQEMRDLWELVTTRCQDMSDARLESESIPELKAHLRSYYSESMRAILAPWLVDIIALVSK